jgi:hypothetical protein
MRKLNAFELAQLRGRWKWLRERRREESRTIARIADRLELLPIEVEMILEESTADDRAFADLLRFAGVDAPPAAADLLPAAEPAGGELADLVELLRSRGRTSS